MRPVSSQRIPESSTAITTSGRPVVTVHAVSGAVGLASAMYPPRTPLFSRASSLTGMLFGSGVAANFQSSPRSLGTSPLATFSCVKSCLFLPAPAYGKSAWAAAAMSSTLDDSAQTTEMTKRRKPLTPAGRLTTGKRRRAAPRVGFLRRAQAVAVEPVVGAVRAQAHRESQVAPRLRPPPGLLQSPPQAEMREVVHRRALDHGGELLPGLGVAAGAEVGAAERLADRGLVGLEATGALERDRGGGEVACLEQLAAALEQVVHVLATLLGGAVRLAHARCPWPARARSARRRSSVSRIRPATSALDARGTDSLPATVTIVTSFSSLSKPMSEREMSLTTTASRRLRSSLPRARSTPSAPCSAANPTTTWLGRRSAARSARTSSVGSSSSFIPSIPLFEILSATGEAGLKSATAALITSTSAAAKAARVASSSSAAVSTST